MEHRIIYLDDSGVVAVIVPAPEALAQHGIHAIAQKDVPAGKPYKIIDAADVPADRAQRNAWQVNAADLTDGVGAVSSEFAG